MNSSTAVNDERALHLIKTGRYLQIAGCQVNPVVLYIRDDGPALMQAAGDSELSAALTGLPLETGTHEWH